MQTPLKSRGTPEGRVRSCSSRDICREFMCIVPFFSIFTFCCGRRFHSSIRRQPPTSSWSLTITFIRYAQNQKIGITFIGYAQNQKIGITFIRYAENQKIGITFIRYAQNQKIGKPNNLKFGSNKNKGPNQDYQNQLMLSMLERGEP